MKSKHSKQGAKKTVANKAAKKVALSKTKSAGKTKGVSANKSAVIKSASSKKGSPIMKKTVKATTKITAVKNKASQGVSKKNVTTVQAKVSALKAAVKTKSERAPVKAPIQPVAKTEVKKPILVKTNLAAKPSSFTQPVLKPVVMGSDKNDKIEFKKGDYVVYPAHGVGRVEGVETHTIAGMEISLYAIFFEQERMRLKVPMNKVKTAGLRKLSSRNRIQDAMATLTGKARIRRVMWSRRAQEYETKINSGDPVQIAEVVRDLHRATDQPEQSYSERQIYQAALERLARELAAVEKIDTDRAAEKLENMMRREKGSSATVDSGVEASEVMAKAA